MVTLHRGLLVKTDIVVGRLAGLALVLALHAAALYGLWRARLMPSPAEAATLFVNFIAPAPSKPPEPAQPARVAKPKTRPVEPQPARQLVAQVPAAEPSDQVAPPPVKPVPLQVPLAAVTAPVLQALLPSAPVALAAELSVACPQRMAPAYPAISRRLGESGVVVLHVDLSDTGVVAAARVHSSSGFNRLDDAALTAVRSWHCTPPTRNGQPVRATALQPFHFVIQGN